MTIYRVQQKVLLGHLTMSDVQQPQYRPVTLHYT